MVWNQSRESSKRRTFRSRSVLRRPRTLSRLSWQKLDIRYRNKHRRGSHEKQNHLPARDRHDLCQLRDDHRAQPRKLEGIDQAQVNLANERVTLEYHPELLGTASIVKRVKDIGYGIATVNSVLPITGMTCANCATTIERVLNKLDGVVSANVNLATEKATVEYIAGAIGQADLIAAIERAGYGVVAVEAEQNLEDVEQAARQAEISDQTRKFWVGVAFALPLFLLSMGRDFGVLGMWGHQPWMNWLFLALATPVQFYVGWDYYVGGFKSLRNGSATWTCSSHGVFGSVVLLAARDGRPAGGQRAACVLRNVALIITLIKLGKLLEARPKDARRQPSKN